MGMYLEILQDCARRIRARHIRRDDSGTGGVPAIGTLSRLLTPPSNPEIARVVELWPESDRERFHERAAIREYDGNMDRAAAEAAAFGDMKNNAKGPTVK